MDLMTMNLEMREKVELNVNVLEEVQILKAKLNKQEDKINALRG